MEWARVRGAPPYKERSKPESDGTAVAWGPASFAGADSMHRGDLFYIALAAVIWWGSWPDRDAAAVWPTDLAAFRASPVEAAAAWAGSWVCRVWVRNLVIEVAIYEAWHQMLFGAFATGATQIRRYHKEDPYQKGKNLLRERLACISGSTISSLYEIWAVHRWASGAVPMCAQSDSTAFAAALVGGGCEMTDLASMPLLAVA